MSKPTPTSFDYEQVDAETRHFLQQKADETHGLLRRTAEHVLRIGHNLKAVKEKLPHGQFLLWIEAEFEMSRWTALHFIQVAEKLEDKWGNFHHLPISVLYALASPSTSEAILTQVQTGDIVPTLEAVKAAKEAERQAREAEREARSQVQHSQQQLSKLQREIEAKQDTIEQFSQEMATLYERIAALSSAPVEIREVQVEVERPVIPRELHERIEHLTQQLHTLKEQRDALGQQVTQLREEARAAALKHNEGGRERQVRLHWYSITNEFYATVTKILAQWPSPADTVVFEADDWTRLSQTTELTKRFFRACAALSQGRIVESTPASTERSTNVR